jgi:hypothetical protein
MAKIHAARGAVELSIVYTGSDTTLLSRQAQRLHACLSGEKSEPISLSLSGERVVLFDVAPDDAGELNGLSVTVRVTTEVGTRSDTPRAREALEQADAVVLVLRGEPSDLDEERAVTRLFSDLSARERAGAEVPIVVQLESDGEHAERLMALGLSSDVIRADPHADDGVRAAFRLALSRASQVLLRSAELAQSGLLASLRESKSARLLQHLQDAFEGLDARLSTCLAAVQRIGETLTKLEADNDARERDYKILRRALDEQHASTRKLLHHDLEELRAGFRSAEEKISTFSVTQSSQLGILRSLVQHADRQPELLAALREQLLAEQGTRLAALQTGVRDEIAHVSKAVSESLVGVQRDLAQIVEGVEDVRSEHQKRRRGFWRAAGV